MVAIKGNNHDKLEVKAKRFLENIGCKHIVFEYKLSKIQYTQGSRPRHWKTKQFYVLDVAGFKDGRLVAVECGGVKSTKLGSLLTQGVMVYILPHGKNKPYLWQRGITVCVKCGHKMSY